VAVVTDDIARQIWEWLPIRTDSRRVTLPHTVAAVLGLPVAEVSSAMAAMERAGHVVRNRAVGRQSGWHRGTPLPGLTATPVEETPEPTLFDEDN
jgi:hypothetical protein